MTSSYTSNLPTDAHVPYIPRMTLRGLPTEAERSRWRTRQDAWIEVPVGGQIGMQLRWPEHVTLGAAEAEETIRLRASFTDTELTLYTPEGSESVTSVYISGTAGRVVGGYRVPARFVWAFRERSYSRPGDFHRHNHYRTYPWLVRLPDGRGVRLPDTIDLSLKMSDSLRDRLIEERAAWADAAVASAVRGILAAADNALSRIVVDLEDSLLTAARRADLEAVKALSSSLRAAEARAPEEFIPEDLMPEITRRFRGLDLPEGTPERVFEAVRTICAKRDISRRDGSHRTA